MITIDGSQGEGGGQILRSSFALSAVTATPITITNVRAKRDRPGLRRQHLTAVQAVAEICDAKLTGASVGSSCVAFEPGHVQAGEYRFDIGTAGSTTLVLQAVLPALLLANGPSKLILEGGTHNTMAPPFDFLRRAYLPLINRMGPQVSAELERYGFYPAGGGRFVVHITPADSLTGFDLVDRGDVKKRRVTSLAAKLPAHIARRECDVIKQKSGWPQSCFHVEEISESAGPGNVLLIEVESEHVTEVFAGFGQRGVKAEHVAKQVWNEVREYLKADVPVSRHLADQLLLPLGLAAHAGSGGSFRTLPLTEHSRTHIDILQRFLDIEIVARETDDGVVVEVEGSREKLSS